MNDTLNNFKVTDRQSFIKFLDLLHKDFLDNPESWENRPLPDFLHALSTYPKDMQGYSTTQSKTSILTNQTGQHLQTFLKE